VSNLSRHLVAAALGAAVMTLPSCTDDTEPQSDVPAREQAAPTPTQSAAESPQPSAQSPQSPAESPNPTASGPHTTPSGTSATAAGNRARLLSAGQLPRLAPEVRWNVRRTTAGEGTQASSVCQQAPWLSIGATEVFRRDFLDNDGASATSLVVQFADAQSAGRAERVWIAWNRGCSGYATAQGNNGVRASGTRHPVDTAAGEAGWWDIAYRPAAAGEPMHVETNGLVRWQRRIACVVITQVGRGFSQAAAHQSMTAALDAGSGNLKS
jgi:hypothetical protein